MGRPRAASPPADRAPAPPAATVRSGAQTSARLAQSQLRRMRRIVDAAVELAEAGGFDAVRLRDVAEQSDVALGTLYKYFRSKEDILLFALNEEIGGLERAISARPIATGSAYERVSELFRRSTRALARRPQFARAVIRAMAVGDPDTATQIAGLQIRITRLVAAALRGVAPELVATGGAPGDPREHAIASTLTQVWFSSLVGWAAGIRTEREVSEQVRTAAALILAHAGG